MSEASPAVERGILRSIGPAIITASVVMGPGSILTSSKVGCDFGYSMIWVLAAAAVLMVGMTALSASLGVMLEGTPCEELARRAGRPVAVLAGVALFLIATCFQFGNNLGVVAAIEPFVEAPNADAQAVSFWPVAVVVVLNLAVIAILFLARRLYVPVEKLMKILVGLMILGFAGNLVMARPSIVSAVEGLVPRLPQLDTGALYDRFVPVLGLVGTTFSVGGAFFQAYLVRQKGWTQRDLRNGMTDSAVGIGILGLITLMIMLTAAAVLHGKVAGDDLKSAADVARQLAPLFGPSAKVLFCLGLFAGALSSFLVNAMIGGSVLSDSLGLGGKIDQTWPKLFTAFSLLSGMTVAILVRATGFDVVNLIVFAQALTVLGMPVLAGALLWLATRSDLSGERAIPLWPKVLGGIGFVVVLVLAVRTALTVYSKLTDA